MQNVKVTVRVEVEVDLDEYVEQRYAAGIDSPPDREDLVEVAGEYLQRLINESPWDVEEIASARVEGW